MVNDLENDGLTQEERELLSNKPVKPRKRQESPQSNQRALDLAVARKAGNIQQAAKKGRQQAVEEDKQELDAYFEQKEQNAQQINELMQEFWTRQEQILSEIEVDIDDMEGDGLKDFFGQSFPSLASS